MTYHCELKINCDGCVFRCSGENEWCSDFIPNGFRCKYRQQNNCTCLEARERLIKIFKKEMKVTE
jgi:hypothetical protein